jgi:hypothetical protein
LLFEDRGQGSPRVFRIDVNPSGKNCLLADKCAREIEASLYGQVGAGFDDLSEQLSQDELFSEVLGAHDNTIGMAPATHDWKKKQDNEERAPKEKQFPAGAHAITCQEGLSRFHMQQSQMPLQPAEQKVGEERQQCGGNGSCQDYLIVHHG